MSDALCKMPEGDSIVLQKLRTIVLLSGVAELQRHQGLPTVRVEDGLVTMNR